MATETNWDAGATTWDRDWNGPDTRTVWDLLPDVVGRGFRVIWQATVRKVAWADVVRRVKW